MTDINPLPSPPPTLTYLWDVFKYIAAVLISVSTVYGIVWGIGLAPVSNGQAQSMITTAIAQNNNIWSEQLKQSNQWHSNNSQYLNNTINALKDQSTRLDERSQDMEKQIQSLQYQINQLRNK